MALIKFCIALLCTSAEAVPFEDAPRQSKEGENRDASSIELESMRAGDRSYGAWRMFVRDPPPGLSVKDELPSGLPQRDELPPGHRDELDWRGREWRKQVATLPDSHAGVVRDRSRWATPDPRKPGDKIVEISAESVN
jgi:hypothetical protein